MVKNTGNKIAGFFQASSARESDNGISDSPRSTSPVSNLEKGSVILGISAFYHDSASALLIDGKIVAAAHEERFTRKKHDSRFPSRAVEYCLNEAILSLEDVDTVVFYDKPLLKFERLLETVLLFSPRGLVQFISSMTVWVKEKLFLENLIARELKKIGTYEPKKVKLLFSEHHLSHAASAFYPSPFEEAAILTMDGVGEWATAAISHGKGANIEMLSELNFPHSVGLLYSAFTYYLGFRVNSGEYKLMGLAPYGRHGSPEVARYKQLILDKLIVLKEDGSVFLRQEYFDYAAGLKMVRDGKWKSIFGFARRDENEELKTEHCDLALAIQEVTEEIMIRMARHAKELTGAKYLCLAGGVALNCVGNSAIKREKIFDDIWIQPAAGDAGGALGAAQAVYHLYYKMDRTIPLSGDSMNGSYLGPSFSDAEIEHSLKKAKAVWKKAETDAVCETAASLMADGKVVGWFQGRMEWGPRALGNRSIIGDPRSPGMQKTLNLKIKFREGFRPFAPSVLLEDAKDYFDFEGESPYMLFTAPVQKPRRKPEPAGYEAMNWKDKLYHLRSDIPSITHLDYSARLQTVSKKTNPAYHALISAFKKKTGYGVIVNTSFNVRGEPIVCTPEDAYRCFMSTHMDVLVLGSYIILKQEQPEKNLRLSSVEATSGTD